MNLNNLELNKKYKWKQLCETIGIKVSEGNSRKKDLKKLESLCRFTKEGQWFTIYEIYSVPKEIKDGRKTNNLKYGNIITKKEMRGEYDGFYVYAHYMNEEVVYVGKGCKRRAIDVKRP